MQPQGTFWENLNNGILPDVNISLQNSTLIKLAVGIMVIMIIGIMLNQIIKVN